MSDNFINKSKEKADIGLIGLAVMVRILPLTWPLRVFVLRYLIDDGADRELFKKAGGTGN
jgi:hypothetical protein